ncbi:SAM-dependent methyltransferase [Amycolatopsis sp. NPDC050768]|uniref:SAM-dependent methyltransferase n=1 Tax=Amycolatopsis sp. NPDC050768 TaxID=3154839 RepID=UPI0033D02A7D
MSNQAEEVAVHIRIAAVALAAALLATGCSGSTNTPPPLEVCTTGDYQPLVPPGYPEMLADLKRLYDTSSSPVVFRSRKEIADFFGDFTLLEPGVMWTPLWHPEDASDGDRTAHLPSPNESLLLAGVARK